MGTVRNNCAGSLTEGSCLSRGTELNPDEHHVGPAYQIEALKVSKCLQVTELCSLTAQNYYNAKHPMR